jgi:hypothetical protein
VNTRKPDGGSQEEVGRSTEKFNPVKKVSYLRDAEWEFCNVTTLSFLPSIPVADAGN